MATETTQRRITCRYCKGRGEVEYGTRPPVSVGGSLAYAIEQHMWEPDTDVCGNCGGRGTVPVGNR